MLFNSIDFAIFLPIVFDLLLVPDTKEFEVQNFLILVASYIFYGWWIGGFYRLSPLVRLSTVRSGGHSHLMIANQGGNYYYG